jgi:hypothetical protein
MIEEARPESARSDTVSELAEVARVPENANAQPRSRAYGWLKRALDRPRADLAIATLAVVLLSFSLDTGLSADDYIHAMIARGSSELQGFARAPLDMYRFTTGEHTLTLMREGVLSWWEDPQAKLAFFRPLSAVTHYFDYQLFPEQPVLIRLHSVLWGAVLFFSVLALYRRLIGPGWICALAIALYVLDDARGWVVSWVAARNAVVATALSIWALYFHHRARAQGFRPGAFLAPLFLALGLLAAEGAIAICGYLAAYALLLDRGSVRDRLLSLAPHVAVVVAWRAGYRALGYGVAHSGLYIDPLAEPAAFLAALAERAPVLLWSQIGGPWSDVFFVAYGFPLLQRLMVIGGAIAVALVLYAIWPLARRDRLVAFALLGALLAVVPASATFTADRLLTWVAIGASLALARLIATYVEARETLATTRARALLLAPLMLALVFAKVVIEPLFMPSRARGNLVVRDIIDRSASAVPTAPWIRDKRVIYVNPPHVPYAAYIAIERAALGVPRPAMQYWVSTGEADLRLTRIDPRVLRVRQRGGFVQSPGSQLLRSPRRPFRRGYTVALDGLEIEVTDLTGDGRPAEIEVRFDRNLDDESLYWLRWDEIGYTRFRPPAVGQSVVVPAIDLTRAMLGDAIRLPIDGRLPAPVDAAWE